MAPEETWEPSIKCVLQKSVNLYSFKTNIFFILLQLKYEKMLKDLFVAFYIHISICFFFHFKLLIFQGFGKMMPMTLIEKLKNTLILDKRPKSDKNGQNCVVYG